MTSRRAFLAAAAAGLLLGTSPLPASVARPREEDERARLVAWLRILRAEGLGSSASTLGPAVSRAGELALGTPYLAHTLEGYLSEGGTPDAEPLTLHLSVFDCVTLVETAVAAARAAPAPEAEGWTRFAAEVERMRYRHGRRAGYASRLHYFSEWIADGARRGLVRDLGQELGGVEERRPLRFMTRNRGSYAGLTDDRTFAAVAAAERAQDGVPRHRVPREALARAARRLESGDILAFATGIEGLDVTHTGLAHRGRDGTLRVLHAPLSGGGVELSPGGVEAYVASLRGCTGILAARPLRG